VGIVCTLGNLPHPDHYTAGFHLHGVDCRVHEHGARVALTVCL